MPAGFAEWEGVGEDEDEGSSRGGASGRALPFIADVEEEEGGEGANRRSVLAYPLLGSEGKESVERRVCSVAWTEESSFSYSASSRIMARIWGTSVGVSPPRR